MAVVKFGVNDLAILARLESETESFDSLFDGSGPADQDWIGQIFIHQYLRGAQHPFFLAFCQDDALALGGRIACAVQNRLHQSAAVRGEALQLFAVGLEVLDGAGRHTGIHRGLGHCRRNLDQQARIEGAGNQVFRPELHIRQAIGGGHDVVLLHAREIGNGVHRGDFHFPRDGGGPYVERAAKNERETQDVVDLIGVVRAAGGNDGVVANLADIFRQDFRDGVGQRKDNRLVGHARHHVAIDHTGRRQAQEHVGALHDLGQRARVGVLGKACLALIQRFRPPAVNHALAISQPDVFLWKAQINKQVNAGQRRCARAAHHQLDLRDVLAHHTQGIDSAGGDDDRGAMLIVMKDRNVQALAQLVRIGFIDFDIKDIDAGEFLEQDAFAFHDRFGCQGADIAQAEHSRAIGDHRHQIAARGVAAGVLRVLDNFLAGRGDPWRVGQCKVALINQLLGWCDREFSGGGEFVVAEGGLAQAFVEFQGESRRVAEKGAYPAMRREFRRLRAGGGPP